MDTTTVELGIDADSLVAAVGPYVEMEYTEAVELEEVIV